MTAGPSAAALRMRQHRAELKANGLTARGTIPSERYAGRIDWQAIVPVAADIVRSYSTGVTLRQLFYQLVARQVIGNNQANYAMLSRVTSRARREGTFPALIEGARVIHELQSFTDPARARRWLASIYRRDRTEGQAVQIILGVEKAGMVEQLSSWFGDLGFPMFTTGGYSSETLERKLNALADASTAMRSVVIYAGDYDGSGEGIPRNLATHLDGIEVIQVALTEDQVVAFGLPENPLKEDDPRTPAFIAWHPDHPSQVELDALDPDDLRDLYQAAIDPRWDPAAYEESLAQEALDRAEL